MALLSRRTLLRALAWTAPSLAVAGFVPAALAEKEPRNRRVPKVFGTPTIGGLDPMGPSPLTLLRDNTDVVIVNTTTETALFTYPIAAYTLDGDRGLRVRVDVSELNDTASTQYRRWRLYLGTTMMYDSGGFPAGGHANSATPRERTWTFEVMAKNSDAIQEVFGLGVYASATEDGTTDLDLVLTVEMDAADPDFTTTHRRSIVELL